MSMIVRTLLMFFSVLVVNAQIRPPKCAIEHKINNNGTNITFVKPRPNLPFSIKTSSGYATVHYTMTGINAVPIQDNNKNQIPDYVEAVCEALDYSYTIIVDSLQYPPPIEDNLGPDSTLDVYLVETFPLYGATYPDQISSGTHLISPTYLEIDNDFENSGFFTKGIDGAKVTVAHELHHVIQYAHYGLTPNNTRKIYEMYSTYLETIVYPDIPDYLSYVNDLFSNTTLFPFGDGNPNSGYHWSIFAIMLKEKYGDTVFKDMWLQIKDGDFPHQALDTALLSRNSSISKEFKDFFSYSFFTNYRAALTKNTKFINAEKLPLLQPFSSVDTVFTPPSFQHNGTLRPFELRMCTIQLPKTESFQKPDTFSFLTSNFDVQGMYNGISTVKDYSLLIFKEVFLVPSVPSIADLKYKYSTEIEHKYFLIKSSDISNIQFAFPLPFITSKHSAVYLPFSEKFSASSLTEITILTSDGFKVATMSKPYVYKNNSLQIELLSREIENLQPGIYIMILHQNEHQFEVKMVIK